MGAIKAKIYEQSTSVYPKIIGFESPETNPALIRAITEYMYASEEWVRLESVPHREDPAKKIVYISWFRDQSPDDAEEDTGAAGTN